MGTINLSIFVLDIDNLLLTYNAIKIRRSVSGLAGPWLELTAAPPQPAVLVAPNEGSYSVISKSLYLKVDNAPAQNITFLGLVNPLTVEEVADQINAVFPGVASADGQYLKLESTDTGTGSKIEILGGTAAADFGWAVGTKEIGRDPYVPLVSDQTLYDFVDKDGEVPYYYQAAYFNVDNFVQSTWSDPFQGDTETVVSADKLSTAYVDLADAGGVAVTAQRIWFYPVQDPALQIETYSIALDRFPLGIETDNTGHAEIKLVRGLTVRVAFEGTPLVREITVPDQERFNLLEVISTVPDPYTVVDPDVPFAIRRSL